MHRRSNKMPALFVLVILIATALTVLLLLRAGNAIPQEYRLLTFFLCVPALSAAGIFIICKLTGR